MFPAQRPPTRSRSDAAAASWRVATLLLQDEDEDCREQAATAVSVASQAPASIEPKAGPLPFLPPL